MKVIGHDHISTDSDVMPRICLRCERHKCGMHCVGCEQFPPLVRAEGDENKGLLEKSNRKRGGSFGNSRTRIL
jgi:hypothetical protein